MPQPSATGPVEPQTLIEQHRRVFAAEVHGSLQNSTPMLDHVRGLLEEGAIHWDRFRASSLPGVALTVDDIYSTTEPVRIRARCEDPRIGLEAVVVDVAADREMARTSLRSSGDGGHFAEVKPLAEGTYRVEVRGSGVASVTDVFVVSRP